MLIITASVWHQWASMGYTYVIYREAKVCMSLLSLSCRVIVSVVCGAVLHDILALRASGSTSRRVGSTPCHAAWEHCRCCDTERRDDIGIGWRAASWAGSASRRADVWETETRGSRATWPTTASTHQSAQLTCRPQRSHGTLMTCRNQDISVKETQQTAPTTGVWYFILQRFSLLHSVNISFLFTVLQVHFITVITFALIIYHFLSLLLLQT